MEVSGQLGARANSPPGDELAVLVLRNAEWAPESGRTWFGEISSLAGNYSPVVQPVATHITV
jgi:hypothetical protein